MRARSNLKLSVRLVRRSLAIVVASIVVAFAAWGAEAAEPEKPDYGFDHSRTIADVEKETGLTRAQIIHHFTKLVNVSKTVLKHNHFHGVPTWQNPFDVWVTQEIIFEMKPDVILEAGTFRGGSALLWAMLLRQVSPKGRVITIDIEDRRTAAAKKDPLARRVDFLLGSSTDPKIVADVKRRTAGKRVLVILDSLHTKEHVAKELAAYADLVPVGGYLIVQDTLVGPVHAIREFLPADGRFEIDRSRERLMYTSNHGGFLKRIK